MNDDCVESNLEFCDEHIEYRERMTCLQLTERSPRERFSVCLCPRLNASAQGWSSAGAQVRNTFVLSLEWSAWNDRSTSHSGLASPERTTTDQAATPPSGLSPGLSVFGGMSPSVLPPFLEFFAPVSR